MVRTFIGTIVGLALAGQMTAAQAITVMPDGVYRLDYDHSAIAADNRYNRLYWGLRFGTDGYDANTTFGLAFYQSDGTLLTKDDDISFWTDISNDAVYNSAGLAYPLTLDPVGYIILTSVDATFELVNGWTGLSWIGCGPSHPCSGWQTGEYYEVAPVPAPPALALFATALAGMGFFGWRKRRS